MRTFSVLEEEKELVASSLITLPPASVVRWEDCKANHRFMAYKGKTLVIYRLLFSEPSVVDKLTCESAAFSLHTGMSSKWKNLEGQLLTFSSTPSEVFPSIFLWHTYYTDVQYIPHKNVFGGRFSLLYRCPHHPKIQHENLLYIQELSSFESEFLK